MDFGAVFEDLELPTSSASLAPRITLNYPEALSAKEINASYYSHPPMVYKLCPVVAIKTDYRSILASRRIPQSQISMDPRLRKFQMEPQTQAYRRDPRRRD